MPFFSFITATFNRAKILPVTIDSMLNQSFSDFEIVLVDDGSTDDTIQVLKKYYANESRLKVIQQQNLERGAARNNGIRNAIGEYLVFVDSDDQLSPNHLQHLHDHIIRLEKPCFISAKYDIKENNKTKDAPISMLTEGWYDYRILLYGNVLGMYCAVKKNNPNLIMFEEDRRYSIMEDWIFNFSNLQHEKIYLTSDCTYHLTNHQERSMLSNHKLIIERKENAKNLILSNIKLNDIEKGILEADYLNFAAIHSYLANDKVAAKTYLYKAIKTQGFTMRQFLLWLKITLGKKTIDRLKTLFGIR